MVDINDLYNIATALDSQMLTMNIKHKQDFRDDICMCLELPPLDFQSIEETLYEREFHTKVGYERGDEININIIGINFKLTKKEAE